MEDIRHVFIYASVPTGFSTTKDQIMNEMNPQQQQNVSFFYVLSNLDSPIKTIKAHFAKYPGCDFYRIHYYTNLLPTKSLAMKCFDFDCYKDESKSGNHQFITKKYFSQLPPNLISMDDIKMDQEHIQGFTGSDSYKLYGEFDCFYQKALPDRALMFYTQAESRLNSFSFSKKKKIEEAAQIFVNSANACKAVREFFYAGHIYMIAAEHYQNLDMLTDAATHASEAANMFSRSPNSRNVAIRAYRSAVQIYRENCKPTQAARLLVDASALFIETKDFDAACETLTDAIQLYEDEKQPNQAATHITSLADIKSTQNKWLEASQLYRRVADIRLSQRLTQLAAGEFITKAVLCQIAANDTIGAENMVSQFLSANPGWGGCREHILINGILEAIKKNDSEAYSQAIFDYDQIKRLDKWTTDVLLVTKNRLEHGEEEDIL